MAKLVPCGVCGTHFAVTDEEIEKKEEIAKTLNKIGTTQFLCKICKKMVQTN